MPRIQTQSSPLTSSQPILSLRGGGPPEPSTPPPEETTKEESTKYAHTNGDSSSSSEDTSAVEDGDANSTDGLVEDAQRRRSERYGS